MKKLCDQVNSAMPASGYNIWIQDFICLAVSCSVTVDIHCVLIFWYAWTTKYLYPLLWGESKGHSVIWSEYLQTQQAITFWKLKKPGKMRKNDAKDNGLSLCIGPPHEKAHNAVLLDPAFVFCNLDTGKDYKVKLLYENSFSIQTHRFRKQPVVTKQKVCVRLVGRGGWIN